MNLTDAELANSLTLSSVLICSMAVISLILKLSGYGGLLTWLQRFAPWMTLWIRHFTICSVLLLEFAFSIVIIAFGSSHSGLPLAAALLLFIASLATWPLFKNLGGCPCFGTMSYTMRISSLAVHTFVLCLVILLYIAAPLLKYATSYCVVSMAMVIIAFGFGRKLALSMFLGSPCSIEIVDKLVTDEIVGVAAVEDAALLLIFLKKRCPACVTLMAYVHRLSAAFSDKVRFVLIIDGLSINETVRFAEAYVVPDIGNVLRTRAKISSAPTLVTVRGRVQKKYVGLNACSQGISDLIYSTL